METIRRNFYDRPANEVAPNLLGHWLVVVDDDGDACGGPIVETEAYLVGDPGSHAFRGRTKRNSVMFGPPGHAYVYFIYGMHFCLNVVTGPEGVGEAVLIRAIRPEIGIDRIKARRGTDRLADLCRGPGRLCQALGIGREHNGEDLTALPGIVVLADREDVKFETTPRVGLTAGNEHELRFVVKDSPSASVGSRPMGR